MKVSYSCAPRKQLCASQGVRSLSDRARDAMCRLVDPPAKNGYGYHTNSNGVGVEELNGWMLKLEDEVEGLSRMLQRA